MVGGALLPQSIYAPPSSELFNAYSCCRFSFAIIELPMLGNTTYCVEVLKMPTAKASKIKIRFVPPGDPVVKRKRRATPAEMGLRADMAQFYAMKSILEEVLGYPYI